MGVFGFGKKKSTIDFTKLPDIQPPMRKDDVKYDGEDVDLRENKSSEETNSGNNIDFLNTMANNSSQEPISSDSGNLVGQVSEISELRTNMKKLTGKIEESSNEVYRLMQRIELLEKKLERFEGRAR